MNRRCARANARLTSGVGPANREARAEAVEVYRAGFAGRDAAAEVGPNALDAHGGTLDVKRVDVEDISETRDADGAALEVRAVAVEFRRGFEWFCSSSRAPLSMIAGGKGGRG